MLTLIDFAKLALHVYKNPSDIQKYLLGYVKTKRPVAPKLFFSSLRKNGFHEIMLDRSIQNDYAQTHDSAHFGFYATFYVKKEHNRLTDAVLAIRGTDNLPNELEDVKSWWRSVMLDEHARLPTHYNSLALAFYYKARHFCREHNIRPNRFFTTGHSLGGALAALLPAHDCSMLRAVTFNAPGIADMKTVKHADDLVINFRSAFDFVSAIDRPVGPLFPIHVPQKEAKAKKAFEIEHKHRQNSWKRLNIIDDLAEIFDFTESVMAQHSMDHLYQAIESACYHTEQCEAYFDPHATFDYYQSQLILPPPFPLLYPGEGSEI